MNYGIVENKSHNCILYQLQRQICQSWVAVIQSQNEDQAPEWSVCTEMDKSFWYCKHEHVRLAMREEKNNRLFMVTPSLWALADGDISKEIARYWDGDEKHSRFAGIKFQPMSCYQWWDICQTCWDLAQRVTHAQDRTGEPWGGCEEAALSSSPSCHLIRTIHPENDLAKVHLFEDKNGSDKYWV